MDLDDMSSAELTMAFPATRMRVRKPPSVVVMVLVWLFLSVALTHVGAKVETPIVDDPLVMELVSWIENQGGAVDERQEIRLQESSHRRRGVFATAPIPAGTVLTSIPWELVVAADDPDDDDPCSAVDVVNRELRYMQGKSAGTPQYAPFIKVLQKYGTKPLMAWSREGQELLAAILGQNIPPSNFAKPIDWWKRDCGGDPDKDLLGLEALFLTVGDPSPNVMTPSEQFQTALVPFYGLYNHRDGAWLNTDVTKPRYGEAIEVSASKDIQTGDQIYISYGLGIPTSTGDAFRGRGVVPDLPRYYFFPWTDYGEPVSLEFTIDATRASPEEKEKEEILWMHGHPPPARSIQLLKEEIRRLDSLADSLDLNATYLKSVPWGEREAIQTYVAALYDAMDLARITPLERRVSLYTITDFPVAGGVNLGRYQLQQREKETTKDDKEPFLLFDDFDISRFVRGDEGWQQLIGYRQILERTSLSFYVDKVARKRWLPTIGIDQPRPLVLRYAHELTHTSRMDKETETILSLIPNETDFVAKPSHHSESTGIWLVGYDPETGVTSYNSGGRLLTIDTSGSFDSRDVAKTLAKSLHSKQKYYESFALKNVKPGIVIEERFVEIDKLDRPPIELGIFTIWGRVWMAKWNFVVDNRADRVSGGFIYRNGTFAEGSYYDKFPFDWLDWDRLVQIAETLGANKDMFRTDVLIGLSASSSPIRNQASLDDRIAAVRYAVSECEIYPTTVFPSDRMTEEAARLWIGGYKIGNYRVGTNTEVPQEFIQNRAIRRSG